MNKKKDYNITPYVYSDFCQLIFTNTEYLYRETGWERLEERRTRRKLQLFYNIQNGSTHPYLLDLYPPHNPKYDYFLPPSKWQQYYCSIL